MKSFSSIVITGASSGIGEALALDYAVPGVALALTGRDTERLDAVATACRAKGATVVAETIDVVDRARLAAFLTAFDDTHPVDLILANAGVSIDKDNSSLHDFSIIRKTFEVNVDGVFNTIEPLLERLRARRRGQIGIVSSLASFIGLPYSASYNGSKAAVRVWGESIRYVLKKDGIGVSVICPGFVVSRITASAPFPMPFMMSAARASAIIRTGLARNKPRIAFPFGTKAGVWLGGVLPGGLTARLLGAA
ncbi:MAG: SDR family NAD(P)-dependent oxidoreductase [Reyranella sp.]|uniref:SDR family NAD(P)-dependent oxidoreductase n=1 Tax=Reyranella sp. TaxID=1929291 RepID=UPI00272F1BDE|nr:SDR family NAD(P)-dependent oxidoreductase [Reyranella sp.]MDP1962581.1 SDR family NAD(P)-dependent oxidoreductase [Reyranella sp.]MDP2377420.1 SDR family NAD(P)-dependent oxidoreductase [Reyranella sp.]